MNKANVFLLVVVSSLLTYISTATQTAATAGVAQEKWEYFQSTERMFTVTGKTYYVNSFPVGNCRMTSVQNAEHEDIPPSLMFPDDPPLHVFVKLDEGIESSLTSKPFSNAEESRKYLYKATARLIELSGEYGWHVFQVDEEDQKALGTVSVMHWRRRVQ